MYINASYIKPRTLDEAVALLAAGEARILSGGTDFYPALGDRVVREAVVDVSGLGELHGVSFEADCFRIGGLTTWSEIIRTPLPRCFDALKSAAREVGGVQIQNRGTVAGNLCNASPAADGVPPLLAVKLGARRYLVISISMVAVVVKLSDDEHVGDRKVLKARVAVGSCSAVARRLRALEAELVGVSVGDGLGEMVRPEHLAPLSPIDDVRATAEYRMDASLRLVQRALNSCVENG